MQSNIITKTKNFAKPFLSVHMGPRSNLLSPKNAKKSRATATLKKISEIPLIVEFFSNASMGDREKRLKNALREIYNSLLFAREK